MCLDFGVQKICPECEGIMVLDVEINSDEWIWECTWCGINELHTEFIARIKADGRFY